MKRRVPSVKWSNQYAPHRGGPVSSPGLVKWDLWWTKWRWSRFPPSTSVSPANLHSTKFSILTITRSRYNRTISRRRAEWTQFGLHSPLCEIKKKYFAGHSIRAVYGMFARSDAGIVGSNPTQGMDI
jgi:hypothetical protein